MSDKKHRELVDHPAQLLQLGQRLVEAGRATQAYELARQSLAARPGDPLVARIAWQFAYHKVPTYHYGMLRDGPRNRAYRQAIEALAPGRVVLDIGSGSGLLAMLAARAGAAHVHTCEMLPQLAVTAREIIAANGLSDRITVHSCHSKKLDRLRDLGGGVDLIVNEILSHDVLGEHVLPAVAHARTELSAPGVIVIPERAAVRVALAEEPGPYVPLGDIEGFDLSLFNRHVKRSHLRRSAIPEFTLRSDPGDLLRFDFTVDAIPQEGRDHVELRSNGGMVNGIAQWMHVELGAGAVYENPPGTNPEGHWRAGFYPFTPPRDTRPGDGIVVRGWHDHESIMVWAD